MAEQSDALVFFGATGDPAHKQIFAALQAMIRRGSLDMPFIGVANAGWDLEKLKARARDILEKFGGGVDENAFPKLTTLFRYIDGDYADPRTFTALRQALGDAKHPVHYLAIPPSMFETVVEQLSKSGSARGARVVIEKPFGRDLASARELNRVLHSGFPETAISASITISARKPSTTSSRSASQTPSSSRSGTDATYRTSRLAENFGVAGRGKFYEEAGAIRDVIQNHLLQVVTLLTCEPPAALTTECIRDERAKLLTSVRPLRGRSHHLDPVGERLGVEELGSPARQAGRDEESKGRWRENLPSSSIGCGSMELSSPPRKQVPPYARPLERRKHKEFSGGSRH